MSEEMIKTIKQIIEFTEDVCLYETENKTMKEVLNYIEKQDHTIDILKEEVEFQRNQRKYWRDSYYQKIDQIYNEKDLINKEAEIMKDNTIKIFTAQDIIKAKFQVIDKLLGE